MKRNVLPSLLSYSNLRHTPERFHRVLRLTVWEFDTLLEHIYQKQLHTDPAYTINELAEEVCITLLHIHQSMSIEVLEASFGIEQIALISIITRTRLLVQESAQFLKTTSKEILPQWNNEEQYLRSLLNSSEMYIVRTDAQGNYTYANRSFLETYIHPDQRENLVHNPCLDHIIPEDHDKTFQAVQRCFAHPETPVYVTLRKPTMNGTILITDWEFTAICDKQGVVSEIQCAGLDVTEKAQMQIELQQANQLLDETGTIGRIGGWEYFVKSDMLRWTKAMYDIYELPYGTDLSLPLAIRFFSSDDQAILTTATEHLLAGGEEYDIELRLTTDNGHHKWVRAVGKREMQDATVTRIYGTLKDITEDKTRQDMLRKSEANLRAIMDSSVQAFCLTDTELRVQEFNKMTAQSVRFLLGRDIRRGEHILSFVLPEQHERFLASARKALAGVPVVYEERFAPTDNDEEQWLELMYLPTYNDDKSIIGLTVSSFNITERKRAYQTLAEMNEVLESRVQERTQALLQMDNEKNEFLGIAAHDLKNPLSEIISSAEILQRYFGDDLSIHQFADAIITASNRMLGIITNLLDVNRIESGLANPYLQRINVEILESIVEEYRSSAAKKNIFIHYQGMENYQSAWILADKQYIRQIFDNLLSNALKYSPEGKSIWVRALHRQSADGYIMRMEVQDEGQGLTEDDKKKLFGKFARLSAQPTGGENSTGLGLSIVKKLVEMQYGRIWCESTFGIGATFIVEFPAENPHPEKAA